MQIDGVSPVASPRPSLSLDRPEKPSGQAAATPAEGDTTISGLDPDAFVQLMIENGHYDADAPRQVGSIAEALKELRLSIANADPERLAQLLR